MKPINGSEFAREVLLHGFIAVVGGIGAFLIKDDKVRVLILTSTVLLLLALFILHSYVRKVLAIIRAGDNFEIRGRLQHELLHKGRDTIVRMLANVSIQPLAVRGHSPFERFRPEIIAMLEDLVRIGQEYATPRSRVWGSLRLLRSDNFYHTFCRAGSYTPARIVTSTPLHKKEAATIMRLRESLSSGRCVIISGSGKGLEMWTPQPNDRFGDDKCVLMGAIMIKSCEEKTSAYFKHQMIGVITLCADREDAFNESHVPWMQGYVDVFSAMANVLARSSQGLG
ncbi:MAG TPA: hypothetical protein VFC07_01395 [Verrucomicrobiae bacterium]|nr:hypothetical protein [Verrucomicrobiae bacterium]